MALANKAGDVGARVFAQTKDLVVDVWSFSVQVGVTTPTINEPKQQVSGFFLGGYVITTSLVALLGAEQANVRVPPPPPNAMTVRVNRLFVRVYNVSCGKKACTNSHHASSKDVVYEAQLVGVDGRGGIAVLRIDPCLPWNRNLPRLCVSRTSGLQWGCSRKRKPGDVAFITSAATPTATRLFTQGVIRENRYIGSPPTDGTPLESIAVQTQSQFVFGANRMQGGAILDRRARVIGIVSTSPATADVAFGAAQFMAQQVVDALMGAYEKRDSCHYPFAMLVPDPVGPYYRYNKGFLDLVIRPLNTELFMTNLIESFNNQPVPTQLPRGSQLVQGYIVMDQVPADSPVQGILVPNDIVVTVRGCRIGFPPPLDALSNVLWHSLPGERVIITYRKFAEHYETLHSAQIVLASYGLFDFPSLTVQ